MAAPSRAKRYKLPPNHAITFQGRWPKLGPCKAKPWPPCLRLQLGYQLAINPQKVAMGAEAAIFTFARQFPHPEDRVASEDKATVQRFRADNRQFPPGAYRSSSLAWRGSEWRQLTPQERAHIHGFPASILGAIAPD